MVNPHREAALVAVRRGWWVFPLVVRGKTPLIKRWPELATTDPEQVGRWWSGSSRWNVAVATGPSGLAVVDLDQGCGSPPPRFVGARHGWEVLEILAADANATMPVDTYTVVTPRGVHLYFQVPDGVELRNTAGQVGWCIDTRAGGGYVVAAGSVTPQGNYRVIRDKAVAPLPPWLAGALTSPPHAPTVATRLPVDHPTAYVQAIIDRELTSVRSARVGTRHRVLLRAARVLGQLAAGGEIDTEEALVGLETAARRHVGVAEFTAVEAARTIRDGMWFGMRRPRQVSCRPA